MLTDYEEARLQISRMIHDAVGIAPISRLKTRDTLLDKIRRDKLQLSRIQDVAGLRINDLPHRRAQDDLSAALVALFRSAKVVDRRERPSHGYRAVHLIVKFRDLPVEVQLRTVGQDRWAQLVERLADRWGRGLRYGSQPNDPDAEVTPGLTRAALFAQVLGLTDLLDRVERMEIDPTVDAGSVAIERTALEAELERLSRLPIER